MGKLPRGCWPDLQHGFAAAHDVSQCRHCQDAAACVRVGLQSSFGPAGFSELGLGIFLDFEIWVLEFLWSVALETWSFFLPLLRRVPSRHCSPARFHLSSRRPARY